MNTNLQLRVQRYGWDKAEPYYENGWKNSLEPAQQLLIKMADISEGEHVLDISSGTGIVSFEAAQKTGETGTVLGVDISENMVQSAKKRASCQNIRNVFFERMEGENLKREIGYFDITLNAFGLMYFPNPFLALKEMYRVLHPKGRSVSAVWGERGKCGWSEIFPIVDSKVKTDVCPMFFHLGTGNGLVNLYEQSGFKSLQSIRINTMMYYRNAEEAINAVFAGGPVAMAYSRFDESTKLASHNEYIESISKYREGSEYFIPAEFVVVGGMK